MADKDEQELLSSLPADSGKKLDDKLLSLTATNYDAVNNYIQDYLQYRVDVVSEKLVHHGLPT